MREDKTKLTPQNEVKPKPENAAENYAREELLRHRRETERYKKNYFDYYDDVKISHREDW